MRLILVLPLLCTPLPAAALEEAECAAIESAIIVVTAKFADMRQAQSEIERLKRANTSLDRDAWLSLEAASGRLGLPNDEGLKAIEDATRAIIRECAP